MRPRMKTKNQKPKTKNQKPNAATLAVTVRRNWKHQHIVQQAGGHSNAADATPKYYAVIEIDAWHDLDTRDELLAGNVVKYEGAFL